VRDLPLHRAPYWQRGLGLGLGLGLATARVSQDTMPQ
jgi:hypothetical protein